MRKNILLLALTGPATLGCAELAAIAPSVTVDVVARQRDDDAGERWSWAVGARLGTRLAVSAPAGPEDDAEPIAAPDLGAGPLRCSVAPLCVWEARARGRALARARAWIEEEP